jgi:DNA-binding transcriptional MocR family regulator
MSLRRREGLVKLARTHDALIICDDVYDFLRWPINLTTPPAASNQASSAPPLIQPPTRLADLDFALGPTKHDPPGMHFGHAISNGSFSKLVSPGVRTGWVVGTADFANGLAQTGSTRSGGAPSQLAAAVVCQMVTSGTLDDHLARVVRPALCARYVVMTRAVRRVLEGFGVEARITSSGRGDQVYGGYFLWLTLPENMDADEVAARAKTEENLVVAPGSMFEVPGDEKTTRFSRHIRLCYSWEEVENLEAGVERLGRVLTRMLHGKNTLNRLENELWHQAEKFK